MCYLDNTELDENILALNLKQQNNLQTIQETLVK